MNLRRPRKKIVLSDAAKRDVARIEEIWRLCQKNFGKSGQFLFGAFSAADAMFAPVVTRFDTYDIDVGDGARGYMKAVLSHQAFLSWREAGVNEPWRIEHDEVD